MSPLERENASLRHGIELLHQVSRLLHRSLELEAACYAVLTGVTAGVGLGFNRAMLFLTSRGDRGVLEGTMAVGPADEAEADRVWRRLEAGADDLNTLYEAGLAARDAHAPIDRLVRTLRVPVAGNSLVAQAARWGTVVHSTPGLDLLGGVLDATTAVAAPMTGADGVLGVLYADNRFTGLGCDPLIEHVFSLVADHAGRAVENARRFEREARAARTDALTGLGHHGALMEHLARALQRSREQGAPLSLVMLDLDNFKGVNDRLGHLAGDALLVALAQRLGGQLREGDAAFRYGGEEFTVVLRATDGAEAGRIAERLRRAVAEVPFLVSQEHSLHVTCSLGVATLDDSRSALELIDAADRALLHAKRTGKNRVVASDDHG